MVLNKFLKLIQPETQKRLLIKHIILPSLLELRMQSRT